jgi:hypothetical protein
VNTGNAATSSDLLAKLGYLHLAQYCDAMAARRDRAEGLSE